MRYGSVCSGIEAASVAWEPLGWSPAFFSEIEPFCCELLERRWGNRAPNLGDMTDHERWPDTNLDVLVGGTPCQSFSVAGLREGLDDPRGNLALTFLAIAAQYRPQWVVWENVPGVLSQNEGRDFGSILGGLGELGYGWAYRVLDAQYVRTHELPFAVPQRRRRVFVVGCLGGAARARAVLFERECLSGNPPPRRAPKSHVATDVERVPAGSGAPGVAPTMSSADGISDFHASGALVPEVSGALISVSKDAGVRTTEIESGALIPEVGQALLSHHKRDDLETETLIPEVADPLTHNEQSTYTHEGENNFRLRNVVACFDETQITHPENRSTARPDTAGALAESARPPAIAVRLMNQSSNGEGLDEDVSYTLDQEAGHGQAVAFKPSHYTRGKDGAPSDVYPPLTADADKGDQDPVIFEPRYVRNGRGAPDTQVAPPLKAENGSTGKGDGAPVLAAQARVRRLTPLECERLQGFPDGYTQIEFRGKPAKDAPRYRALGNSMATNVMEWIGRRIAMVEAL